MASAKVSINPAPFVQFEEKMDAMNRNKMFPEAPDDAAESD